MAKKAASADDKSKDKKKKKKGEQGDDGAEGLSVATHPRARSQVRRAKGWGGLIGFAVATYLSLKAGVPAPQTGLRALGAGIAGYLVAWACAVSVWRHLVLAELRAAFEAAHGGSPSTAPRSQASTPDGAGEGLI
jgi:hypothetical protein